MIPVKERPKLTKVELEKNIFIKESYLDKELCKELVKYGKENQYPDINFTKWAHKFEVCGLPLNHNIHNFLNNIWEEAITFFNSRIDFIEQYSLKGYTAGSFFSEHHDNYICVTDNIDRKLTLIVQLSEDSDYVAGDVFVNKVKLPRSIGSVIIFPSSLKHNVTKLKSGERWSLVTWAWGPAF